MLFKNKYTETKDLLFKRCFVPKSVDVGAVLWVVLGCGALVLEQYVMAILWFIVAVVSVLENSVKIKSWEKKYNSREPKDTEITVEFHEENVLFFENGVEKANWKYDYFADMSEDTDCFRLTLHEEKHWEQEKKPRTVFIMGKNVENRTFFVMKNGFEQGDVNSFKEFMKTKSNGRFKVY